MTDIYLLQLKETPDPLEFSRLLEVLPQAARDRLLQIKFHDKACQSLFSELMVRQLIIGRTGLKNEEIRIERDAYGKPYAEGLQNFHFNYSHSGDWVACAVSSRPVGLDIQEIKAYDPKLPHRYFSPKELQYILDSSEELHRERFFDLWSLKEAYLKMLGIGIRVPLNSFSILIRKNTIDIEADQLDTCCRLYKFDCIKGYKLALCTAPSELRHSLAFLKKEEIINNTLI